MLYSIKIVLQNGDPVYMNDVIHHTIDRETRIVEINRLISKTVEDEIFVEVKKVPTKILLCLDAISYMETKDDAAKKEN